MAKSGACEAGCPLIEGRDDTNRTLPGPSAGAPSLSTMSWTTASTSPAGKIHPAMDVAEFDYELPAELIAQSPPEIRGASRLLVLDRATGATTSTTVAALADHLRGGDVLVVNDTRVVAARLLGQREPGGGAVECLLLARTGDDTWDALVHPGQRMRPGRRFRCERGAATIVGEIVAEHRFGRRTVRLHSAEGLDLDAAIDIVGHVPLPPYIHRPDTDADRERYQTMFARVRGAVAAPTAGLHFTDALVARLEARGVARVALTLHVGYGTFKPVRVERVEDHVIDAEVYEIGQETAATLNDAMAAGRRIIAVGTTTTRALETAVRAGGGRIIAGAGVSELFIYPGFDFRIVGGLFTNFHVPRSSLLMLVCAFAGREQVLGAYRTAIAERFRFYSYGDAMLMSLAGLSSPE